MLKEAHLTADSGRNKLLFQPFGPAKKNRKFQTPGEKRHHEFGPRRVSEGDL